MLVLLFLCGVTVGSALAIEGIIVEAFAANGSQLTTAFEGGGHHSDAHHYLVGSGGKVVVIWQPFDEALGGGIVGAVILRAAAELVAEASERLTVKVVNAGWGGVAGAPLCATEDNCPDVLMLGTTQVAGRVPDLLPLNAFMRAFDEEKGTVLIDDILQRYFYEFNILGNWYALPAVTDTRVLFFNRSVYDDLGVRYPPPHGDWGDNGRDWTWPAFAQESRNISRALGRPSFVWETCWNDEQLVMSLLVQNLRLRMFTTHANGTRSCTFNTPLLRELVEEVVFSLMRDDVWDPHFMTETTVWDEWLWSGHDPLSEAVADVVAKSPLFCAAEEDLVQAINIPSKYEDLYHPLWNADAEIAQAFIPGALSFLGGSGFALTNGGLQHELGWSLISKLIDAQQEYLHDLGAAVKSPPPFQSAWENVRWRSWEWDVARESLLRSVPPLWPLTTIKEIGALEAYKPFRLMFYEAVVKNMTTEKAVDRAEQMVNFLLNPPLTPNDCLEGMTFDEDTKSCLLCLPGSMATTPGGECEACAVGFATLSGRTCVPCPPGQYTDRPGTSECLLCDAYSYHPGASSNASVSEGVSACMPCPRHQWTRYLGSDSVDRCECQPEYYWSVTGDCLPCPYGAVCDGGRSGVVAKTGFWNAAADDFLFLSCFPPESCPGGEHATCTEGYEGSVCGKCSRGTYRKGYLCERCGPWGWIPFMVIILVLVAVALFALAIAAWVHQREAFPTFLTRMVVFCAVTIDFLQLLSAMRALQGWPRTFATFLEATSATTFDVEFLQLECVFSPFSYSTYYKIQLISPLILGSIALLILPCLPSNVIEYAKSVISTVVKLGYIRVLIGTATLFNCIEQVSKRPDGSTIWLLADDRSVECYKAEWMRLLPFFILSVLLYGVGVYVLFSILAWHFQKEGKRTPFLNTALGLYQFRRRHYYWQLVIMARRFIFGLLLPFTTSLIHSENDKTAKLPLSLYLLALVGFLVGHVHYRPYLWHDANWLEIYYLFVLIALLCFAAASSGEAYYEVVAVYFILVGTWVVALIYAVHKYIRRYMHPPRAEPDEETSTVFPDAWVVDLEEEDRELVVQVNDLYRMRPGRRGKGDTHGNEVLDEQLFREGDVQPSFAVPGGVEVEAETSPPSSPPSSPLSSPPSSSEDLLDDDFMEGDALTPANELARFNENVRPAHANARLPPLHNVPSSVSSLPSSMMASGVRERDACLRGTSSTVSDSEGG